jgi:hypothetical protein
MSSPMKKVGAPKATPDQLAAPAFNHLFHVGRCQVRIGAAEIKEEFDGFQ